MHVVLESIETRISRELSGLDADTAQKHPGDKAYLWSMQQVAEHLMLSYRYTAQKLEDRLRKGLASHNRRHSLLQWVLQFMVLSFGHFPRGVPALNETAPTPGIFPAMDGDDLASSLRAELQSMDKLLDRCRQRFGMERVAVHPLLGPLRVDQWRRYHAVHTQHHLEQLQRIRMQVAPQFVADKVYSGSLTKELHIPAQRSVS